MTGSGMSQSICFSCERASTSVTLPALETEQWIKPLMELEAREWRDEHGKTIIGAHWVNRNDVVRMLGELYPPAPPAEGTK